MTSAARPWRRTAAALAAVLAVLLVLLTLLALARSEAAQRTQRDQAILSVARGQVLDLVDISPSTAQASFDRALAAATGEWKQRLVATGPGLAQVVSRAQVDSRASITEAGVRGADERRADVLVTAQLLVGNAAAPTASPRALRFLLALQRDDADDGAWRVSNLEIAP